jgi:hypothetical protein
LEAEISADVARPLDDCGVNGERPDDDTDQRQAQRYEHVQGDLANRLQGAHEYDWTEPSDECRAAERSDVRVERASDEAQLDRRREQPRGRLGKASPAGPDRSHHGQHVMRLFAGGLTRASQVRHDARERRARLSPPVDAQHEAAGT